MGVEIAPREYNETVDEDKRYELHELTAEQEEEFRRHDPRLRKACGVTSVLW